MFKNYKVLQLKNLCLLNNMPKLRYDVLTPKWLLMTNIFQTNKQTGKRIIIWISRETPHYLFQWYIFFSVFCTVGFLFLKFMNKCLNFGSMCGPALFHFCTFMVPVIRLGRTNNVWPADLLLHNLVWDTPLFQIEGGALKPLPWLLAHQFCDG